VSPRRVFAIAALAAIIALRLEPRLLRLPFIDRSAFAQAYARMADRLWIEYPRFLEGVRAHTRPGDAIAIVVPSLRWDDGYSYAYYRASYFLAGREVLPLADAKDRLHPENFRAARYVAVWRTELPARRYEVVWSGHGGVLLRR
jgi:hypothetical protein